MAQQDTSKHLSRISTLWTMVADAKGGPGEAATAAQQELLQRYSRAVHRYLQSALRNRDAADELAQEFFFRFLRGDCKGANPQRGRFRDYLKGVLSHLIADYYRRQRTQAQPLSADNAEEVTSSGGAAECDRQFLQSWRDELLGRTWDALARLQEENGQPFHAVLCFRIQHPDLRSAQMAEQLSEQLHQPVTADWVRQNLHRGREKFADLLLAEVADTLKEPTAAELAEELSDLGLLSYCHTALNRRGWKQAGRAIQDRSFQCRRDLQR
jgi:RNA polymerase sigma-70 factor (ECF subfamily)